MPVGARFSAAVQTGLGAHPTSCTMGTGSFPRVKSGRGVTLTPHPLLVPWSKKSIAIPLLPLWATQPVESLSACTRVQVTLLYYKEVKDHSHCVLCTVYPRKTHLIPNGQETGWAPEPNVSCQRKKISDLWRDSNSVVQPLSCH